MSILQLSGARISGYSTDPIGCDNGYHGRITVVITSAHGKEQMCGCPMLRSVKKRVVNTIAKKLAGYAFTIEKAVYLDKFPS